MDAAIYNYVQTNRNNAYRQTTEQLKEPIAMYDCVSNSQLKLAIHPITVAN